MQSPEAFDVRFSPDGFLATEIIGRRLGRRLISLNAAGITSEYEIFGRRLFRKTISAAEVVSVGFAGPAEVFWAANKSGIVVRGRASKFVFAVGVPLSDAKVLVETLQRTLKLPA